LDGMTLEHRIAGKSMDVEEVLSLGIEIADALVRFYHRIKRRANN
jgi:hypothetical protein